MSRVFWGDLLRRRVRRNLSGQLRHLRGALAVRDHALIKIGIASQLPRAGARLSQLLA